MIQRFLVLILIAVGVVLWRVPNAMEHVRAFMYGTPESTVIVNKAVERMKNLHIGNIEDWAEENIENMISGEKFIAFLEDLKPESMSVTEYCAKQTDEGMCEIMDDVKAMKEEIVSLRGGVSYNMAAGYIVRVYGWDTEDMPAIDYLEDITGRTPWKSDPNYILTFEDIAWILARIETA